MCFRIISFKEEKFWTPFDIVTNIHLNIIAYSSFNHLGVAILNHENDDSIFPFMYHFLDRLYLPNSVFHQLSTQPTQ